jgi:hypothetical protein
MLLTTILIGAIALAEQEVAAVREAALRESLRNVSDPGYFVAYCVSQVPGTTAPANSREQRVSLVARGAPVDASPEFLSRFKNLAHHLLPASACATRAEDWEVIEKVSKRGPALLLEWGPVEVISRDHVVITERSNSGFLTETFTEYELRRAPDGRWSVIQSRILLQA